MISDILIYNSLAFLLSGLVAAVYCVEELIKVAENQKTWGGTKYLQSP